MKLYQYIRDKDWGIELVCAYPCLSKAELLAKEDEYIHPHLTDENCLNSRSSILDKQKDKDRKKAWYETNKERILAGLRDKYHAAK